MFTNFSSQCPKHTIFLAFLSRNIDKIDK
uniref:Uncharacterized protein n=1 Tax=Heterorhabditis bacteriophora TaxID=37862 RepID=A0A1I7X132_HETBA